MTATAPFYLDCDTGIDDALALAYLLAAPAADLVGIGAVSGNVSAAVGARNTLDLLQLAGAADIPVALGAHDPLAGSFGGGAPWVHGENGIGEVSLAASPAPLASESAAEMLVRLARTYPGTLRVLAIGPLTNIAEALRLEPALPSLVHSVTVMGGAALAPGNITPVAEANIWNDPEAAALVLAADWDITLVPLDVTMGSVLEDHHRQELLASSAPVPRALGEMLGYYFRFYEGIYGRPCSAMHDPLAAALAVGAVQAAVAPVVRAAVDTSTGPSRGQTVCDMRGLYAGYPEVRGARCRVVLSLEQDFAPHLVETLLGHFSMVESAGSLVVAPV
ncbi:nucleoside hydrolase [Arthrobacter nitrophenolicus]|uniref:Purine nucleosidase n=2 Tax=Arthrobacter nitrophenolicus TaxID=683150 RepID=A0ACC6TAX4_9MICC|nr:nucleoside hydrolase [Arthrobacter nitrophenolicus]ELT44420.1 inosine-uridine nucleoside N-ribohydrolase [Arthrobacter nitrophenolicus]